MMILTGSRPGQRLHLLLLLLLLLVMMSVSTSRVRYLRSFRSVVEIQPGDQLSDLAILFLFLRQRVAVLRAEAERRQAAVTSAPVFRSDAVRKGSLVQMTLSPVYAGAEAGLVFRTIRLPSDLRRGEIGVRSG